MSSRFFLAVALLMVPLAGCLSQPGPAKDLNPVPTLLNLLAGPSIWSDPQNAPHPLFGWPTLSSPAPGSPRWWLPIQAAQLPTPIVGLELAGHADKVAQGAGIAIFGSLAVVPDFDKQAYVVDISDPAHPNVLSTFFTQGRGAAIIAYPTGRLVTVLATSSTIDMADITDPYHPNILDPIRPTQGSHKLGVVPGTPIVYNAASNGGNGGLIPGPGSVSPILGNGVTEIFDLTDPEKPVHVQDWKNGYSCHHVFFWNNPAQDKYRAICAGIEYTQIWDTKDPRNPSVIVSIPVHYGLANGPSASASIEAFSHSAGLSMNGNVLYVGDENGGGAPPGCVASVDTPAGAVSTPIGATWFYDVSTETNPRLLGWYSPLNHPRLKEPIRSCTTHHGRLVPDPSGRDLLAMSYYGAGVVLIDFTGVDLAQGVLPHVVDQWVDNSDTWETWYNQGYLFTGDLSRGMDVLKFT